MTAATRQMNAARWFQWNFSPEKKKRARRVNTVKVTTSWITLS